MAQLCSLAAFEMSVASFDPGLSSDVPAATQVQLRSFVLNPPARNVDQVPHLRSVTQDCAHLAAGLPPSTAQHSHLDHKRSRR